jgi:hypothetical protein
VARAALTLSVRAIVLEPMSLVLASRAARRGSAAVGVALPTGTRDSNARGALSGVSAPSISVLKNQSRLSPFAIFKPLLIVRIGTKLEAVYTTLMAANDNTPNKSLQDLAADYFRDEFGTKELDQLERKDKVEEKLGELLPTAVKRLEYLLNHGESESVVWQVSKYILNFNLGNGTEDELGDLIRDQATTYVVWHGGSRSPKRLYV